MFGIPTEVLTMVATAAGSWWMKKNAQDAANRARQTELFIQAQSNSSSLMDASAKRSSPWLRKFAGITILLTTFGGLLVIAFFKDIPVSIVKEVPQKSFLFGLFKWGSTVEVIQAFGLVQPPWISHSICAMIGFLFGPGFAKTR